MSKEFFKNKIDKGFTIATILSLLLAADKELAAKTSAHEKTDKSGEYGHRENIISAREVIIKRTMDYVREKGIVNIDAKSDTPENLLARVMMSEEGRDKNHAHIAVLIAWTVLNRLADKHNFSSADLKKVITSNKDFGLQSGGRQFSSNINPISLENKGVIFRIISSAVLGGAFDDYNFGQTNFMHVATQNNLAAEGRARPASEVIKKWEAVGLEEIDLPGINSQYVKFFKPAK